MDLTTLLEKGTQGLLAIAFPTFRSGPTTGWGSGARWLLHVILVATVLVSLWGINDRLDVEKALRSPWPWAHQIWLPLLFLLVYVFAWLAAWVWWRLLDLERPTGRFADIDDAWSEARDTLHQARIDIDALPLFLFLGRPAAGDDRLFQAAGVPLVVSRTPQRLDAPFHIHASREAIFVTCAESSLLGRQAKLFAEHALLVNKAAMDETTARLGYLCRLVAKARHPYCPVNGLVLLIPLAAMAGATEASQVATLTQLDVQAIYNVLQIDCPYFAVICDLERAPGFREFMEQVPAVEKRRPLGQRFPLMPDVESQEIIGVMQGGIDDLAQQVLSRAVVQSFRTELTTEPAGRLPATVGTNFQLCRLLTFLRQGCQHLSQILYRGTQVELGTPAMVAGCYLVATGADEEREQAFAAGIFQEILEKQNYVAWAPRAIGAEKSYRRLTRLGYLGLLVLMVVLGVLGYVGVFGGHGIQ